MDGIRSVLIKDTTREERIRIVNRSLSAARSANFAAAAIKLEVSLQFRGGGRVETYYQPYIDGE